MGQIVRSSLSVFVFKIYSLKTPYQKVNISNTAGLF